MGADLRNAARLDGISCRSGPNGWLLEGQLIRPPLLLTLQSASSCLLNCWYLQQYAGGLSQKSAAWLFATGVHRLISELTLPS